MSRFEKMMTRRSFIVLSGGALGSLVAACGRKGAPEGAAESKPKELLPTPQGETAAAEFTQDIPYAGFRMGVQSWCFREFKSLEAVIEKVHSLGLAHVEIAPSAHLPVDTPLEEVKAAAELFKKAGITIDACGVVGLTNDEAACRKVFDYAKALGVMAISVSPEYDALPLVDKLTEEYGLPVGIHNHGPEDKLYATPDLFREHLARVSNRVGLCVDTGHFNRSGVDPLQVIDEFPDRIHGIHLKDMVKGAEGKWEDAIVGKGDLDLPGLLKKLKEIGFKGYLSLEYESDPSNPLPAMEKCLAEVREACKALA